MLLRKIVIFEDEFLLANDLKRQIEQYEYRVTAMFRKGEDGVSHLSDPAHADDLPDIVLMDISLRALQSKHEFTDEQLSKYR